MRKICIGDIFVLKIWLEQVWKQEGQNQPNNIQIYKFGTILVVNQNGPTAFSWSYPRSSSLYSNTWERILTAERNSSHNISFIDYAACFGTYIQERIWDIWLQVPNDQPFWIGLKSHFQLEVDILALNLCTISKNIAEFLPSVVDYIIKY